MRKLLFTLLILAGSLWACEKESQKEVSPLVQQKSASGRTGLTSEEKAVSDAMGKIVPLTDFKAMTAAYQKTASSKDTRAVAYGTTIIDQILSQPGCVGMRIYFAKDASGKNTVALIGVDKNGNDITSVATARTTGDSKTAADGPLCPAECSN